MPRIFARWATNSRTGISRKDALSANEFAGVQSNDAAVLRDRRGTLKGELPNTSEKAETLGDGPLAIYKPSGSKHVGDGQFQRLDVRGRQQTISLWLVPQRAKLDDKLLMPIADWLFRRIRVVLTARKL